MTTVYSIKGSSFKTKLEFVQQRFGEQARIELERKMEEEEFPSIFDSGWYPFTKFVRLLQILAESHLKGDISRLTEVGEFSGRVSLSQTYKAYVSKKSFSDFLESSVRMHRMLYSHGRTERSFDEDGCGCRVIYLEKPMIAEEDLYVALGFFCEAGKIHGLKSVHGHFTTSNDGAVIALRWSEQ